jgi:hypothetical protein
VGRDGVHPRAELHAYGPHGEWKLKCGPKSDQRALVTIAIAPAAAAEVATASKAGAVGQRGAGVASQCGGPGHGVHSGAELPTYGPDGE